MKINKRVMILNLPSPPRMDIFRDYSGAYGTGHLVNRKDYGHSGDVLFPVFMPYLASAIKKAEYELKILDAQAMRLNLEGTIEGVRKEQQPTFLISMLSLPSIYGDLHLLNKIKENFPEIYIITLGTSCKFLAEEILTKSKVDFLIDGEYPPYSKTIINLIHALVEKKSFKEIPGISYKENSRVIKNLQESTDENLDSLDLEIYKEFPIEKYRLLFSDAFGKPINYFPILSGKGCPFSCIYCPYPIGFGNKILYKSPEFLVNEMEFLNENFKIKAFVFRDQVFTANKKRIEKICNLILEKNLKVNWLFETRADKISKDLLRKMKEAGCNRIHYGVETGDETLLKVGKPGLNKTVIRKVFKNTMDEEIFTMAHVILGLPGENEKTLLKTYKFILELNPDCVSWNLITPYPGTKLFEIAKKKNLILTYNWEKYNTEEIVMKTEELSSEKLLEMKKKFGRNFRIRKIFERVKKFYRRKEFEFLVRGAVYKISEII